MPHYYGTVYREGQPPQATAHIYRKIAGQNKVCIMELICESVSLTLVIFLIFPITAFTFLQPFQHSCNAFSAGSCCFCLSYPFYVFFFMTIWKVVESVFCCC